jgi:hypothetical protein
MCIVLRVIKDKFTRSTATFSKDDFKNFEPIFQLIKDIIDWKYDK